MDSKVVLLLSSLHTASSSHDLAVLMEPDAKLQHFHLVDIHLYVPLYTLGKFLFCHLQACSLVIFIIYNLLHRYLNQVSIKCTVTHERHTSQNAVPSSFHLTPSISVSTSLRYTGQLFFPNLANVLVSPFTIHLYLPEDGCLKEIPC